jgi:hypothetical protein
MSKLTETYQGEKVKELTKTYQGGEMKKSHKIAQTGKELIAKSENPIVVVNISDDVIDFILDIGNQVALWAKPTETGFSANDKIIEEIIGRIVNIKAYLVKWIDKQPHKIPINPGEDLPEGYEPRCDLFIDVGGQVIAISLSKSSLKFHLSPYVRNLKNKGLGPEDVITRLRVKQATNKFGSFNVVIFDLVDKVSDPTPVTPPPIVNKPPASLPPQPQGSVITQSADPSNPWA